MVSSVGGIVGRGWNCGKRSTCVFGTTLWCQSILIAFLCISTGVFTNPSSDDRFDTVITEQFAVLEKQKETYLAEEKALMVGKLTYIKQIN